MHRRTSDRLIVKTGAASTMVADNLSDFIRILEENGELRRVDAEVDPNLEIAEILRRTMYSRGPAILFTHVKGSDMPVLGNAFGSMRRLELGLGMSDFTQIGERIASMTKMDMPTGMLGKLRKLPELSKMTESFPKPQKSGPVSEVVGETPSFNDLPILKTWPKDAGRFITFGLVATRHPETGTRNLGVYRMQIIDDTHAIMHWQKHKRGAHHGDIAAEKGERIPAAVIIGGDPGTVFSGVAPVPEGLDKYLFAGIARGRGIRTVPCRTIDLDVPAEAEIILEGYVDPSDQRTEGPFGDHTGYYHPAGAISCLYPDRRNAPPQAHLSDHHSGQAGAGRCLHRKGDRALVSAADADVSSGDS